jgi:DNA polymerase I-like protein with 3'-5' exonuclease and polymerase domains
MVGAFLTFREGIKLAETKEAKPKKKRATKPKTKKIVEISIPSKFDFIDWAGKVTKLAKSKEYEVVFKDRPEEEWAKDPLIPQTEKHFEMMMEHLAKHNDITCDVETSGLSYVDPKVFICGHVLTTSERSYYVPIRHNTNEPQLDADWVTERLKNEVFNREDCVLNFHNAPFDYNQMLKDGVDISPRFKNKSVIDTQIMWWLLDENQKDDPYYYILHKGKPAEKTKYRRGFKGHSQKAKELGAVILEGFSLKVLAPKYVGTPMTKFDDLMEIFGFHNLPIHFGGAYARVDGVATHKLKEIAFHRIKKEKLETSFYQVEMPFARTKANMERRGMGINLLALDRMEERAITEKEKLKEELFAEIGEIKFSGKQLTALFHDKLGLPVLAKTDKGNPQFNEEAMDLYEEYLEKHSDRYGDMAKLPAIIIRIKKLEKIIGTYIKGIRTNIDVDCRIHCSLFQTSTVTGRLSSGNPNLQNLPTKPVYKDVLDKEEMIKMRQEIGDLDINKKFDFTVLFLDEDGEALGTDEGWEEKCVKVIESWGFRDVFSEKNFTPELKEKYKADYPRYGEVDAYFKDGKLVTLDLTKRDWLYEVSDYSQMELRMIAHLANATSMIQAYKDGVDIHKSTARDVFLVELDKVTKDQRGSAKAVNFGLIYGKTTYGFAIDWYSHEPDFYVPSNWHPSGQEPAKKYLELAQEFIDRYFDAYPDVKEYMESRQKQAGTNGYVRMITGRKRRLPEIFSESNSVRNRAKRQAVNAIDQGSSADYLKISMNELEYWSEEHQEDLPLFQVLTVHDEIIFLTIRDILEQIEPVVVEKMTQTVKLRCPIDTEPVAVYTYGSAK